MNEVEPYLTVLLGRLSPDHPDRRIVESQLSVAQAWNARRIGEPSDGLKPLILKDRFPVRTKRILEANGATFYTLEGQTIEGQKSAREQAGLPAFWHIVDVGDRTRLLALPSRRIEMAIFSNPQEFFVPNSFNQDTDTQERLARVDAEALSRRLKLRGITQIIADEAATLTELVFKHQAATGQWLFGSEYAEAQGLEWVYGRTKNPTDGVGSRVADVGAARPDDGLDVDGWYRDVGLRSVGAPRLVVAIKLGN